MVCLCRSLYITRLVKQRQFFMSVLSVRGFGPYFLKKPKQTNNQKTQKTSFGNISFSWTSASAVDFTSCKWLGTERAMGTIFAGIHFPKRIPLGINVIQHFIILKHVPGGGCRLQTCPECLRVKFVTTIRNIFLSTFPIMIQGCFITALMQKLLFNLIFLEKNDSFLLEVSQNNIVHFYEPEIFSNRIFFFLTQV